jgi:hypothetical protein
MSCVGLSLNLTASLPAGASLEPPTIGIAGDVEANLCCQMSLPFALQVQLPGIALTADLLAGVNTFLLAVDAVVDAFQFGCPFD